MGTVRASRRQSKPVSNGNGDGSAKGRMCEPVPPYPDFEDRWTDEQWASIVRARQDSFDRQRALVDLAFLIAAHLANQLVTAHPDRGELEDLDTFARQAEIASMLFNSSDGTTAPDLPADIGPRDLVRWFARWADEYDLRDAEDEMPEKKSAARS